MRCGRLFFLWCFLGSAACSDPAEQAEIADEDAGTIESVVPIDAGSGCAIYVADPLIEHSCFHAQMGPFRDREVPSAKGVPIVEVSRAHTAFNLKLAPDGERYGGSVRYDVRLPGAYAFFVSTQAVLSVVESEGGGEVTAFSAHDTEICSLLPRVQAFSLDGTSYTLRIESDRPDIVLVIEYMDEGALENSYRTQCDGSQAVDGGDGGSGDAGGTAVSTDAATGVDAGEPDSDMACVVDLVLEHSCLHVQHGPFATVSGSEQAALANVNMVHTAFTVTFANPGAGKVGYRPNQTGQYVFYVGSGVQLVLTQDAVTIPPLFVEPVPGCDGLARAFVFDLKAMGKYILDFAPETGVPMTSLVVENVTALAPGGWSERWETCE